MNDLMAAAENVADQILDRVPGPSLDRVSWALAVAAKLADRAATDIREADLNPAANIRRVGEA